MSRWLRKSEWEIFGVSAQAASGLRRDIAETSSIHQQPAISSMRDHRPIAVIVIAAAVAMAGCARDNRPAGDTTRSGASASAVSATATTSCSGDKGGHGGTGIALHDGALYAEEGGTIVRYALPTNGGAPTAAPTTVVSGLPTSGDHPMHPFAIDSSGTIYVDLGSASNSCQLTNRVPN